MGLTFYLPISRLLYVKEFKVIPPRIAYHFLVSSAASDPSEGERYGNRKMFIILGMEGKSHYHNHNGVGDAGGEEAKVIIRVPACCFHHRPVPVLLEGVHRVPYVWMVLCSGHFAEYYQDLEFLPPLLGGCHRNLGGDW